MADLAIRDYLKLVPVLKRVPHGHLWASYDSEADVLYLSFGEPTEASDSELTDDDVILRYKGAEIVGLTVLHASERCGQ